MKQYFETAAAAQRARIITRLNERGTPITNEIVDAVLEAEKRTRDFVARANVQITNERNLRGLANAFA